jgi:hypothetical protein
MQIYRALLKYGYSNFSCQKFLSTVYLISVASPEREKYFIDFFLSEYNTVKDPTLPPMSNRTHSDESKKTKYLMLMQERIILTLVKLLAMKL